MNETEMMDISLIKPYLNNPRKIPKKAIEAVANSIRLYGFQQPIVIDKENVVVVGHTRLQGAIQLGMKKVPIKYAKKKNGTWLTKNECEGYRLADNRTGENSKWDNVMLAEELENLKIEMPDIDLTEFTGFSESEINKLLDGTIPGEDAVPDIRETDIKVGDMFKLGDHRLLCGDSTKAEDVERLMDGKNANMVFTSPPYNVGHNIGYKNKKSKYINSDDNLPDYKSLLSESVELIIDKATDIFINVQILANNKKDIVVWLAGLSEYFKDIFYWKKKQVAPAMAKNVANSQVEIILLFGKNNSRRWGNKEFRGNFSNYIETKSASSENENAKTHNATFPVGLPEIFIIQGYKEKSIILDIFLGTGSTLISCEKNNRICYGMELDPVYCQVIIDRWEKFTKKKAKKI